MNIFTKIRIYGAAYMSERSDVDLKDLIETKARELEQRAPKLEQQEGDISDELALRHKMGDIFSNLLQQIATRILEAISQLETQIRDLIGSLQELAEKRDEFLQNTADYHFARREARRNMFLFCVVAIGEIGAMFIMFTDYFGIDPTKITSEALKHPISVFATIFFTVGYFIATLLIAEQVLISKIRLLWITALIGIATLIGKMRADQVMAMQEIDINSLFMPILYTAIGIIFPLAAVVFARRWQDAAKVTGLAESTDMRLAEQVSSYNSRLTEANTDRTRLNRRLDQITGEYVNHYQRAVQKREELRKVWENHHRYVEAYLAELRYAYNFWTGWHERGMPKAVKRGIQIAALLLIILIVTAVSCSKAQAESKFNLLAICDRSSSAIDISCTPELLMDAGLYWIGSADEAGGGIFEVFVIDKGFDTAAMIFSAEYPERFPGPVSSHKKKWKNGFLQRLTQIMKSLPTNNRSAVAEAIYRASLRIPDGDETLLYVMSDMRQFNTVFNFEKNVPSEKEFLNWLEKNSVKPAFTESTSILVCGIHPYTPKKTSRMTTVNYARLLKLWRSVFMQWGVKATITEACSLKIQ